MNFFGNNSAGWERRLDSEVTRLRCSQSYREVTLKRWKELVSPPNEDVLVRALAERVSKGVLSVRYRIVSPTTHAALRVVNSLRDVPEFMPDDSTGTEVEIDPFRNVEPVYVSEVDGAR